MIVNGVTIERDGTRFVERWIDMAGDQPGDYCHLFTAEVTIDQNTGEYRLVHLRCEVIGLD